MDWDGLPRQEQSAGGDPAERGAGRGNGNDGYIDAGGDGGGGVGGVGGSDGGWFGGGGGGGGCGYPGNGYQGSCYAPLDGMRVSAPERERDYGYSAAGGSGYPASAGLGGVAVGGGGGLGGGSTPGGGSGLPPPEQNPLDTNYYTSSVADIDQNSEIARQQAVALLATLGTPSTLQVVALRTTLP
ncbi:hypothetical protein T492DRAFT_882371 [Pavlovales sp. CCMP2436]|nr:hypothetical protein T492DRAFT_882371 [Pavlovales sp. CCMP2436]